MIIKWRYIKNHSENN